MAFDGVISAVAFGASSAYAPANITVSFWAKWTSGSPAQFDAIMGKTNGSAWTQGWGFFFNSSTDVRFFIEGFSTNVAFATIAPTNWNHIVGTWGGSTVRIYVNGVEGTSDAYAGSMTAGANPLEIGRLGSNAFNFIGPIDDTRIYSRALSAAEIQTLYAENGIPNNAQSLVGHWRMNELEAGDTAVGAGLVKDLTPTGGNGTPEGGPVYAESVLRQRKMVA